MKILAIAFVFSGVVLGASAAGWSDRLYVNGKVGAAWRDLDGPLLHQPNVFPGSRFDFRNGSSDRKVYGAAQLGYALNGWFSVEAGYQNFGTTYVRIRLPVNVTSLVAVPENYRFRDQAYTLDPVFTWRASDKVSVYGFWGVAFNRTKVDIQNFPMNTSILSGVFLAPATRDSRSTQSRLGGGVTVQLSAHLSAKAGIEYQRLSSFAEDGWLGHVGLNYAFGE